MTTTSNFTGLLADAEAVEDVPQHFLIRACAHDFFEMNTGLVQIDENELFGRPLFVRGRPRTP